MAEGWDFSSISTHPTHLYPPHPSLISFIFIPTDPRRCFPSLSYKGSLPKSNHMTTVLYITFHTTVSSFFWLQQPDLMNLIQTSDSHFSLAPVAAFSYLNHVKTTVRPNKIHPRCNNAVLGSIPTVFPQHLYQFLWNPRDSHHHNSHVCLYFSAAAPRTELNARLWCFETVSWVTQRHQTCQ